MRALAQVDLDDCTRGIIDHVIGMHPSEHARLRPLIVRSAEAKQERIHAIGEMRIATLLSWSAVLCFLVFIIKSSCLCAAAHCIYCSTPLLFFCFLRFSVRMKGIVLYDIVAGTLFCFHVVVAPIDD